MVFSLAMLKDQKTSWTLTIDMLQLQTVRSIHFPLTSGSPVVHIKTAGLVASIEGGA